MASNLKKSREARAVVIEYLSAYVGERALAGSPQYDKTRKAWRVPILVRTPRGIFLGGQVQLDHKLQILHAPSKQQVNTVVTKQLAAAPYLVFAQEGELEAKGSSRSQSRRHRFP